MRKQQYISMMCLISLTMGTASWAQGPGRPGPGQPGRPVVGSGVGRGWGGPTDRHFGGPDQGIPRIGTPVFNTGCGQTYAQPAQVQLRDACIAGGAAGLQTAERYGAQQGRNDGFRTGYAWGVRSGIDSYRNDQNQVAAGSAALNTRDSPDMIQKLSIADQAGATAGAAAGAPNGDQEAVARFHGAIDTGVMPTNTVTQEDYARYNPQYTSRYNDPYTQTIGGQYSEADLLNNGQRLDYGNVTFYSNGYDSGLYGSTPTFRPGDFYRADGRYSFDRNSSLNGAQAFNVYLNRSGFDRATFMTLGSVQIITGYTQPAAAAPAAPGAPAAPAAAPAAPQPILTTYNLKEIFQKAFVESYEKTAGYYYNGAYNDMLDDGTNAGWYLGVQVGQRLAYQSGLVNAYVQQFRQRETSAFYYGSGNMPGYQAAFNSSFLSEYNNYLNNPQIGVDSFSIAGVVDDGIVQPGEGINASFVVRNYGGVAATLPVSLEGDVTGATSASLVVPAISSSRQSGSLSATISSNVASQSNANVVLNVNGNRVPLAQYVTRQVTAGAVAYTADFARGAVAVTLPLRNVSRVNSYDAVKVVVTDSIGRSQTVSVGQGGFLAGNESWSAPINLAGFDQLDLIDGRISIKVQAFLGSLQIASGTVAVSTTDKFNQLASAFEVINQGGNAQQISKIVNRINSDVKNEAINAARTDYDDRHESLLRALVNAKTTHQQTVTTSAAYASLATMLAPIEDSMAWAAVRIWPLPRARSENQKWFEKQMTILKAR